MCPNRGPLLGAEEQARQTSHRLGGLQVPCREGTIPASPLVGSTGTGQGADHREIHQKQLTAVLPHDQVARMDVTVNNAGVMNQREKVKHLAQ
jgi:hypothetical protein